MAELIAVKRLLAALLLSFAAANVAKAADQEWPLEWYWIAVTPDSEKNWVIERGQAQVEFHNRAFEAKKKNGDCLLRGTISGKKVIASETLVGTDARPRTFHGDIQKFRTKLTDASSGWGEDRISLFAPGGFYVGLFRRVRSGAKPGD